MTRLPLLLAAFALTACGLRPLYSGGGAGTVAGTLRSVEVAPIEGRSGWLVRNNLVERLGGGATTAAAVGCMRGNGSVGTD